MTTPREADGYDYQMTIDLGFVDFGDVSVVGKDDSFNFVSGDESLVDVEINDDCNSHFGYDNIDNNNNPNETCSTEMVWTVVDEGCEVIRSGELYNFVFIIPKSIPQSKGSGSSISSNFIKNNNKNISTNIQQYTQSTQSITELIEIMSSEYMGKDYNLFRRNCCTFCRDLVLRVGLPEDKFPSWVSSLGDNIINFSAMVGLGECDNVKVGRSFLRNDRDINDSLFDDESNVPSTYSITETETEEERETEEQEVTGDYWEKKKARKKKIYIE